MKRLSKSGIEYLTRVWNFYSGCRHKQLGICPPDLKCWAEKITNRFSARYPNGFEPTFYPDAFLSPLSLKKPARIGCAFMGDLFGDWIDPEQTIEVKMPGGFLDRDTLKAWVFNAAKYCPQHTFLFLTKAPWNYKKWSPFPDNCWVGATVTDGKKLLSALDGLDDIQCSKRFISAEPLLGSLEQPNHYLPLLFRGTLDWVIIGQQTPVRLATMPKIGWVEEIVQAADKVGIPVFLKDNLVSCVDQYPFAFKGKRPDIKLRQEFPK